MNKFATISIIGLGGNFSLRNFISFLLSFVMPNEFRLNLIDGGDYKVHHRDHESFTRLGNKAIVSKEIIMKEYPGLNVKACPFFIGKERSALSKLPGDLIHDEEIVFLCCDNAASILLVQMHCATLANVIVISGGIFENLSYVQIYIRINSKDITPPFSTYNTHIAHPQDELPTETLRRGCTDSLRRDTPNVFSLMMTDSLSLCVFYSVIEHLRKGSIKQFSFKEIYFDVLSLKMRTVASNP